MTGHETTCLGCEVKCEQSRKTEGFNSPQERMEMEFKNSVLDKPS